MNDAQHSSPLDAVELVINKSRRPHFFTEYAIADRHGILLGHTRMGGDKLRLILFTFTDGVLFPSRPDEVEDSSGKPVLCIEHRGGGVRRHIATVRRPDGTLVGRLIGRAWGTRIRNKGYRLEVDNEPVGEILVVEDGYQIVDSAGAELARITKRKGTAKHNFNDSRTTLQLGRRPSESLVGLAVAATVFTH